MELNNIELLLVLDVLSNRIGQLGFLCKKYPNASLVSDWKSEISTLENFCKKIEDSVGVHPVPDDFQLRVIEAKNTLDI